MCMITTYLYQKKTQKVTTDVSFDMIKEYATHTSTYEKGHEDDLLWIDIYDSSVAELTSIGNLLHFHPLAIEDCLQHTLRSKIDKYENHTFFIFNSVTYAEEKEEEISTQHFSVFLGKSFIVTVHPKKHRAIGQIVDKFKLYPDKMVKGPDYLLYSILDSIVDSYFPTLERLSERIDELEDEMYVHPAQAISEEFLALKRTIVLFRRVIQPQKRIFFNIRNQYMFTIQEENIPYFMDLVDHLERIADSLEVYRDLVSGAMDTYFSLVSARTNHTMKRLTIITTITAGLTSVTGFYGMNLPLPFDHSPATTMVILSFVLIFPFIGWLVTRKDKRI